MKAVIILILFYANILFSASPAMIAELYNSGEYRKALREYSQLLEKGYDKGRIYYNIGNCYFKLRDYVNAIYYYEKAKKYIPINPSLDKNLELAKEKAGVTYMYNLERDIFYFVSLSILKWLVFVFSTLVMLTLTVCILKKRVYFILLIMLLISFFVWIGYFYKVHYYRINSFGIIQENSVLYTEPRFEAEGIESINAGARVKILEEYKNFFKIKINNDLTGWIKKDRIKKL